MTKLRPGDPAPPFALRDQHHRDAALEDFRGRSVLVYFYPKADTPGCTTQSCAVRDAREELAGLAVDVLGISPDEPEDQAAFDRRFSLGFPLLSDTDHAVAEAWGVWGEKERDGVTYFGVVRSAFLVDANGLIRHAWYGVSPEDTVPNVRSALAP